MSPRRRSPYALGTLLLAAAIADESAAFQEPAPPDARALEAGWDAFRCGDLHAADASFRAAARQGQAEGWLGQAEVARLRTQAEDALIAFREYFSRVPGDERNRLEFARLLSWERKYSEAEYEFRRLAEEAQDPQIRAAARRGLADTLAWSGRHREAHRIYSAELAMTPEDAELARALGELESWRGRHGSAARHLERSLAGREDPRAAGLLAAAARELRPEAFVRAQAFADDADWKRGKVLVGGSARLFPEQRPDGRTDVALEYATFEEASGRDLARRSLIVRHRDRPSPFVGLDVDLALGETRGAESWRGGIALDGELRERIWAWGSIRSDDWIDPVAGHAFDRYNGAFTVDLQRREIVQATTLRGGMLVEDERGAGALAELSGGPISDGNGRLEAYAQFHRRREYAPGRQSIPRVFYHHIGFADASPLYWSPENLDSWGAGWRWEAREERWIAFADAAAFWQFGGVDDYGVQLGAGVEREFDAGFRLRLEANFLSSDDRGLADRYEAYALMLTAVVPF